MSSLPNIITLCRIPLTVLFFVFFAIGTDSAALTLVSLVFLIAAGLSDAADGYLARRMNAESKFGRLMDPLLDKVLICGGFTILIETPYVAPWMVVVIVSRELLVTALRSHVESSGVKFGANVWGKAKMIIQWIVLLTVVAAVAGSRSEAGREYVPNWVPTIGAWIATIVTALSAISYVVSARHILGQQWSSNA